MPVCRAEARSPAPTARATSAVPPMPTDCTSPPISHVGEAQMPTAAVATAPREPTIAVSTRDTRVEVRFSTIHGQASAMITARSDRRTA